MVIGVVEHVNQDGSVYVSEMNWNGHYNHTNRTITTLQAIILFTNKFIDIILIYSDVRVQWLCNLA